MPCGCGAGAGAARVGWPAHRACSATRCEVDRAVRACCPAPSTQTATGPPTSHRAAWRPGAGRADLRTPAVGARCTPRHLVRDRPLGDRHELGTQRAERRETRTSHRADPVRECNLGQFRERGCAANCGADSVHSSRTAAWQWGTTPTARDRKGADHDDHRNHSVPWNPWTRRHPVPRPLTRSVPPSSDICVVRSTRHVTSPSPDTSR